MLIIGKTPTPVSVNAGHYFQGRQGTFMWSQLRSFRILDAAEDEFEDDALIRNGYGITDVVKVPREFGSEPMPIDYAQGWPLVARLIDHLRPEVTFWPYKGALDRVLKHCFGRRQRAAYGFNPVLNRCIGASVFVFGMQGTPCSAEARIAGLGALRRRLDHAPRRWTEGDSSAAAESTPSILSSVTESRERRA